MSTTTGLFGLLPNELILQVADLLPIVDVISLKNATYSSIQVLESRITPSEYLKRHGPFTNTEDLMDVMAKHGAALSGSRALAYFIPGLATRTSDWDFYVPPIPASVMAVKNALVLSGVAFESCLEGAARQLQGGRISLTANQVVSIAYEANSLERSWLPRERIVIDAIRRSYPKLKDIELYTRKDGSIKWIGDITPLEIDKYGSVSVTRWQEGYPATVAARVLNGSARKRGDTVSVQLIVGCIDPRKPLIAEPLCQTVFRSIFGFYASHVQCILTKHAAFHMYYKLAVQNIAYAWHVPRSIRKRAEDAVEKYKLRGFAFRTAPEATEWTVRSAQDEDSCLIELCADGQYYPTRSQIRDLRWQHKGESIQLIRQSSTIEARKELLKFGIVSR